MRRPASGRTLSPCCVTAITQISITSNEKRQRLAFRYLITTTSCACTRFSLCGARTTRLSGNQQHCGVQSRIMSAYVQLRPWDRLSILNDSAPRSQGIDQNHWLCHRDSMTSTSLVSMIKVGLIYIDDMARNSDCKFGCRYCATTARSKFTGDHEWGHRQ